MHIIDSTHRFGFQDRRLPGVRHAWILMHFVRCAGKFVPRCRLKCGALIQDNSQSCGGIWKDSCRREILTMDRDGSPTKIVHKIIHGLVCMLRPRPCLCFPPTKCVRIKTRKLLTNLRRNEHKGGQTDRKTRCGCKLIEVGPSISENGSGLRRLQQHR